MEKNEREIEIDLKRLLLVLWSRAWVIVLISVLFAAVAFSYAWFFITPTYSASAQLYVNNNYVDSPGFSSSQIAAAQDLADTYMVILESRNVLGDVAKVTELGYSYGQLKGMVSAAAVNETEVFQVTVTCTNYKHAAVIANAIADVLPDKIAAVVEGSSVRVVDRAVENPNPVGPSYQRYLILGAVVGAVFSIAVIILADLMDTTINSEDYLAQVYGKIPLLAVVPGGEGSKSGYYKGYYESAPRSKKSGGAKK